MSNSLSKFTRRHKVVKSIQFELIPQGKTRETMEQMKFDETDENFRTLAGAAAPYIDDAVRSIVNHALLKLDYDFSEEEIEADGLTKAIDKQTALSAKEMYGIKVSEINSAKFVNDILPAHIEKMDIPAEEKAEALLTVNTLKGKTAFVAPFLTTRITAITNWMPKRILENMAIYEKNRAIFDKLFASELADDIRALGASDYNQRASYVRFLSQDGIDAYNRIINGTITEKGIETKGVRMLINEYNLRNKDASLPLPKELYKQILMPSPAAFTIGTVQSDEELTEIVTKANAVTANTARNIVDAIKTARSEDLVVPYNKLHTLSHLITGDHSTVPVE